MDEDSSNQGVAITSKHLGFIITLFTVLGIIYGIINGITSFTTKIELIEKEYNEVSGQLDTIQDKFDNVNEKINILTNTVTRLDERLNSRIEKSKR